MTVTCVPAGAVGEPTGHIRATIPQPISAPAARATTIAAHMGRRPRVPTGATSDASVEPLGFASVSS